MVIPARYGSQRLPGKPLADICGAPMVVRVAAAALASGADEVRVATDDARILAAAEGAGVAAELTRPAHVSGTDRVAEVAARAGWDDETIIINLQGDEPLMPPAAIRQVADALAAGASPGIVTLCATVAEPAALSDPNVVKVVCRADGQALYFSRAGIPCSRRREVNRTWRRHIGLYGYRLTSLRRFVALPPSPLEQIERLEQLRALEAGLAIQVLEAAQPVPGGVDTEADLERVRRLWPQVGPCRTH